VAEWTRTSTHSLDKSYWEEWNENNKGGDEKKAKGDRGR